MSDDDSTYNGWTNHETWCVNLWISNDEVEDCVTREIAHSFIKDDGSYDAYEMGRLLEERFAQEADETLANGMFMDLLTSALQNVNWKEIASYYLSDAAKKRIAESQRD